MVFGSMHNVINVHSVPVVLDVCVGLLVREAARRDRVVVVGREQEARFDG
jgi:hypothetical protein